MYLLLLKVIVHFDINGLHTKRLQEPHTFAVGRRCCLKLLLMAFPYRLLVELLANPQNHVADHQKNTQNYRDNLLLALKRLEEFL